MLRWRGGWGAEEGNGGETPRGVLSPVAGGAKEKLGMELVGRGELLAEVEVESDCGCCCCCCCCCCWLSLRSPSREESEGVTAGLSLSAARNVDWCSSLASPCERK